jgi:hypothetical protein
MAFYIIIIIIKMDFVYLLIIGNEWEDIIVFLSKEDAIRESINHLNQRIEIFSKTPDTSGYTPTYHYYLNGELIENV